jgi:hypothetical protein
VRGSSNCNVHNFSSDSNNATLALLQIQLSGQDQEKDEEKQTKKERKMRRIKAVHSRKFSKKRRDDVHTLREEGRGIAKKRYPVLASSNQSSEQNLRASSHASIRCVVNGIIPGRVVKFVQESWSRGP